MPLIDPTKNVLDLVAAESRYRDAMRVADQRYQDAMREAEIRRANDLRTQRAEFDRWKDELLRRQVLDIADVSNERLAKLEQFRYENSGKSSGAMVVIGYIALFISVAISVAGILIKTTH